MIGCFSPFNSYAVSEKVTTDNPTDVNNKAIPKLDSQDGDEEQENDEKQENEKEQEDFDENNDKTTESAITTTTTQGIEVKDNDPKDTKDTKDSENSKDTKNKKDIKDEEALWYRKQNPMKKDHQKLLWEYCKKRDINYIDMLALIYTESNFHEKCFTGKYYGYFQISKGNCSNLAKALKTENKPLDGTININWGTAMYSWILADKRVKGLKEAKKRDVVLSIFQRGPAGYDKYGISTKYLKIYYKKRNIVSGWF